MDIGSPDSFALIGRIGHNPDYDYPVYIGTQKDWAGTVTIYTNTSKTSKQFARREISSDVIIPFAGINDAANNITVNFTNDYSVGYFSIVPVSYSGFTQNSLTLVSAVHSVVGDISSALGSKDSVYAYLDSTCVITLQFQDNTTPGDGTVRDYVMQYDGHYTVPGSSSHAFGKNGQHDVGKPTQTEKAYSFMLYTNYPNPFNPSTSIRFSIPKDANTTLKVYNTLGQLVATLVNGFKKSGEYEVSFNGENHPSGVYFYRLEAEDFVYTKKMVLIK